MAQGQRRKPRRIALISWLAQRDRVEIFKYTRKKWGIDQARAYRTFLDRKIRSLAKSPNEGSLVSDTTKMRRYLARWNNTRDGHWIYFEETERGIMVLRILHTSMDQEEHLGS